MVVSILYITQWFVFNSPFWKSTKRIKSKNLSFERGFQSAEPPEYLSSICLFVRNFTQLITELHQSIINLHQSAFWVDFLSADIQNSKASWQALFPSLPHPTHPQRACYAGSPLRRKDTNYLFPCFSSFHIKLYWKIWQFIVPSFLRNRINATVLIEKAEHFDLSLDFQSKEKSFLN